MNYSNYRGRRAWICRCTRAAFIMVAGKVTHFLAPNLDVFGHNSAISCPNCFILGSFERRHRALSTQLKKMKIGAEMAELWRKMRLFMAFCAIAPPFLRQFAETCAVWKELDAFFPMSPRWSNLAKKWLSYGQKPLVHVRLCAKKWVTLPATVFLAFSQNLNYPYHTI